MRNRKTALNWALAVLLLASLQYGAEFFEYNRPLILQGQIWRLVSGHFIHYSYSHGLMNFTAASLMALLFATVQNLKAWLWLLLSLSLGISLGLLFFCPTLEAYRGLSGLLHSVFMLGVFSRIGTGEQFYWLGLFGLLFKLWQEWPYYFSSPYYSSRLEMWIAIEAHLLGVVFGIIAYGWVINKSYKDTPS